MSNFDGRPSCPIVYAWALRFGLTRQRRWHLLTDAICWQLARSRSDEARRLILGMKTDD